VKFARDFGVLKALKAAKDLKLLRVARLPRGHGFLKTQQAAQD
jgi:hypothetical protein